MKTINKKQTQQYSDVLNPVELDPVNVPSIDEIEHRDLGQPSQIWPYHNEHGQVVGFICRFDVETDDGTKCKEIRPYSYVRINESISRWLWKGLPEPRPLYDIHHIQAEQCKPILVCEGEKTADAGAELFPEYVATTPQYGAKSPHKADWSIVNRRDVVIAADFDEAGEEFANKVAELAHENGASSIKILAVDVIGRCVPKADGQVDFNEIGNCPKKFDLADAKASGFTSEHMINLMENHSSKLLKYKIDPKWPYVVGKNKVFQLFENDEGEQKMRPVFSKMRVVGRAKDQSSEDWSTVVEITDASGREHIDLIRASEIIGPRINEVKERLTAKGLVFESRVQSSDNLWRYIAHAKSNKDVTLVTRCGWQQEGLYATPSWSKSKDCSRDVFFDCKTEDEITFASQGTLEDWQENIAIYGDQNYLIAFAISAAIAGAVLNPLSKDGFGVHIFGASSTGKTTLLRLASSVWGDPSSNIKNWNMTTTALEGTAVIHNDALLCLDEISQADPQAVYAAGYELANGQGRGRGTVLGTARERNTWRLLTLSNGEIPFEQLALSKASGQAMAGQKARMVSIPADAGDMLGIFNHIPEHIDGAAGLAQMLNQNAKKYFGTAAPAFVGLFMQSQQEAIAFLNHKRSAFIAQACADDFDGQVQRVADHFGTIAAVGEYAIQIGVVPWEEGHAFRAAMVAFKSWLNHRGGTVSDETIQGVKVVRQFFQQHGESRFTPIHKENRSWEPYDDLLEGTSKSTQNRAGYRFKDTEGQWNYFVFRDAFNDEICAGRDAHMIAKELARLNHLEKDSAGKHSVPKTVPGHNKIRVYVVKGSIIDAEV